MKENKIEIILDGNIIKLKYNVKIHGKEHWGEQVAGIRFKKIIMKQLEALIFPEPEPHTATPTIAFGNYE